MKLKDYVQTTDFCRELPSINHMLDRAEAEVTFLGKRVVRVKGFDGTVEIDKMTQKVDSASKELFTTDAFTLEKRAAGIEITNKLFSFHKITSERLKNANKFTQTCNQIKEIVSCSYEEKYYNVKCVENILESFTKYKEDHLLAEFGMEKREDGNYPDTLCRSFNDDRLYYVPEKIIWEKLVNKTIHSSV